MDDCEDRIRRRAHELWEREGKPEGRETDFWVQAEREVDDSVKEPLGTAVPSPTTP
jgi:Protein of unknown function (DUF2934)